MPATLATSSPAKLAKLQTRQDFRLTNLSIWRVRVRRAQWRTSVSTTKLARPGLV